MPPPFDSSHPPFSSLRWKSVLSEFNITSSLLSLGERIQSSSFTLLDSMSAMEVMDPTIDSGMYSKGIIPITGRTNIVYPTKIIYGM